MKRGRGSGIHVRLFSLFVLALAGFALPAGASVHDEWQGKRVLSVQGGGWCAQFHATEGAVSVAFDQETVRLVPFDAEGNQPGATATCSAVEREGQKAEVNATFPCGAAVLQATFAFTQDGTVEIRPGDNVKGIRIQGDIRYGVLPGIFLEDVVYDPAEYPGLSEVCVPSENLILGLLQGGNGILACTWPEGNQKVRLLLGKDGPEGRAVDNVEITLDSKSAFLTILNAPGIWHREELLPTYLENDVEVKWKRPFTARWKTELLENDVRTAFVFGERKDTGWRPFLGFYTHPVWFDGEKTMMHLAKKIPPEGHAFIYPLEGHERTPLEFVKRTPVAGVFAKRRERESYPKGPRNAPDVGFTHCWGTAIIKRTIYQYGIQKREQEFLVKHIDYCLDYVASIQMRNGQFYTFIEKMRPMLEAWMQKEQNNRQVLEFLKKMKEHLRITEEGYQARVERDGRKTPAEHIAYADKLGERLKSLIREEGTGFYPEYMYILGEFNALSAGSDEGIPAGFGAAVRKWFQVAGHDCADNAGALPYAEAIRKAIWEKLKCRSWETTGL